MAKLVPWVFFVADLVRILNPTLPLATEADAVAAGRAGAVAAFLTAASSLFGALMIILTADAYVAQLRETTIAMYGATSETAKASLAMMTPTLVYFTAITSLVFAAVYVVLGVVQWRKPNTVIPLLLGLFAVYGLVMMAIGHLSGSIAASHLHIPVWRQALSGVIALVAVVLFYNGFRGASRLSKLRAAASA